MSPALAALFPPLQVGLAASNALAEEEDPQLQLSLVGNLISGYMRQCKVVSDFKVDPTADGEKIRLFKTL